LATRIFPRRLKAGLALVGLAVVGAWPAALFSAYVGSLGRAPDAFEHTRAIVSLAGGPGRLGKGLDLLDEGKADVLLLSGTGKGATLEDIFPGRDLSSLAGGKVILLENRSTSTYENAIEAWAVLAARGEVREIVLLTSNYHMLRSEFVFRKVFPADVEIRIYPVEVENVAPGLWWKDAKSRRLVLNEYLKYLWYRLRY
jgi:hypothetical protein